MVSATFLAGAAVVAGAIGEYVHHQTVVIPLAVHAFMDRFDLQEPEKYGNLSPQLNAALFVEDEVVGRCATCFSPSVLDHVRHVYVKDSLPPWGYNELLKECPQGDSCTRREGILGYLRPVADEIILSIITSSKAPESCVEDDVEGYRARYCHTQLVRLDEVQQDTYSVRIEPAKVDIPVRVFGEGALQTNQQVVFNYVVGQCRYWSSVASVSDFVLERCLHVRD